MGSCEENEAKIHRLIENELHPDEEKELRRHLASCRRCSETMQDLLGLKSFIEEKLDSEVRLCDASELARSAAEMSTTRKPHSRTKKYIKRGLLTVAAGFVAVIFGGLIFAYFYFGRTFPNEISDQVLRCSRGLQARNDDGDWTPLKVSSRLKTGERITTPDDEQSFLSFNGIRLLSAEASEFEFDGSRKLSFLHGDLAIESGRRKEPVEITAGPAVVSTNGSSLRISGEEDSYSVACISGKAQVRLSDGDTTQHLAPGETAAVGAGQITISSAPAEDLFAFKRTTVLDRIRDRFQWIISRYAHVSPINRKGQAGRHYSDGQEVWSDEGLQMASYAPPNLARLDTGSVADYYETLFAPSNRTLSIGRQKLVAIDPTHSTPFPEWSHDGSMIAYGDYDPRWWPMVVKAVRLDDLEHPWQVSQECNTGLPFFPIAWSPDDRHIIFMSADDVLSNEKTHEWWWRTPYHIKIAPVDPNEGPLREFESPFYDIPLALPINVGKTISPVVAKLPWGDAVLCANWGNLAYIPIEEDGQAVWNSPGLFLTNFNPRELYVLGGYWSPSGSKILFTASEDLNFDHMNVYILYEVEDILDGFTQPPRSVDDPRIKKVAPAHALQIPGGFSFDESLVFFAEDVNGAWRAENPTDIFSCDFDLFYANALPGEPGAPVQIHLPGNQMYLRLSPEGNRIVYRNYDNGRYELRVVSFDVEADIDADLGGVLIDNSGTNLIIPPGALERNLSVKISTPFNITDEAELNEGETTFFAMRLIDAKNLDKPQFIEPMTLTIRYTDDEVYGLDEGMLEVYYYDESNPKKPVWVPLGGTVDPVHNEITVEIQHFSKFSVGGKARDAARDASVPAPRK